MYHFLFNVSKRLFRRNFLVEEKIDSKKEQIIDFCPRCNMELPDKKVITLLNHDKKFHPKTEKEIVRDFYKKGSVQIYVTMTIVVIVLFGTYVYSQISFYLWELNLTEVEKNAYEFCIELKESYPDFDILGDKQQSRLDRTEFIMNNLEELEKCNYTLTFSSFGTRDDRIENYLSIDD